MDDDGDYLLFSNILVASVAGDSGLTMDGGSKNSSDTDVKATTPVEKALVVSVISRMFKR